MKLRYIWLALPLTLGIMVAALAVAAPAQAGRLAQEPQTSQHGPPHGEMAVGLIESFPEGLLGSWTVTGIVYTATEATHFSMFGGPFYNGACVEVRYDPSNFNAYAIDMVGPDRCGPDAVLTFIGLIEQVPDGYSDTAHPSPGISGTWLISGTEFVSTLQTRLKTRNGPLAVGACARVEYREINGANIADEIRTEKIYRCYDAVSFNQAYGYVVVFPEDLYGAWIISDTAGMSLTFMTTPSSRISVHHYPLETGACIKVKYFNDQGVNYASKVETKNAHQCEGHLIDFQPASKLYAALDSMPPTSTITGTWVLAGVNFTSTLATRIEEEQGPLQVGNCTEAKYDPAGGSMLLNKLESEEAWDCQAHDGSERFKLYGVVELMPTSGFTGTWQVSGVTFTVPPTATVESRHGELITGAYVKVYFTFDAATGERTAQSIQTHVAPGYGHINHRGRFGGWMADPSGDQILLDGAPIAMDADVDIPNDLQVGDLIWANGYQEAGSIYITQVTLDNPIFLPLIQR